MRGRRVKRGRGVRRWSRGGCQRAGGASSRNRSRSRDRRRGHLSEGAQGTSSEASESHLLQPRVVRFDAHGGADGGAIFIAECEVHLWEATGGGRAPSEMQQGGDGALLCPCASVSVMCGGVWKGGSRTSPIAPSPRRSTRSYLRRCCCCCSCGCCCGAGRLRSTR